MVLIAGGGVAGLETLVALRKSGGEHVPVTLVSASPDFRYRALGIQEPFGSVAPRSYELAEIAADLDARLLVDEVRSVDRTRGIARLRSGDEAAFDTLVMTVGAIPRPAFEHGVTFDRPYDPAAFDEVLADRSAGLVPHLMILIPPGVSWTLPAYELALLTAMSAAGDPDMATTLVTPELLPLEAFGGLVSRAVGDLLDQHGIALWVGASADVTSATSLTILPSGEWSLPDRIVSLPWLAGPRIAGLPFDGHGFIPVDQFCRVPGADRVYAAGDGTSFWMKQGGLAAQQADVIAQQLAAAAGADIAPRPFAPILRGLLPTTDGPLYLRAELGDDQPALVSHRALWWPPTKIASRWLGPYLAERDLASAAASRPFTADAAQRAPAPQA